MLLVGLQPLTDQLEHPLEAMLPATVLSGAFYIFRVKETWWKCALFTYPLQGGDAQHLDQSFKQDENACDCSRVLCMAVGSASGIKRNVHVRFATLSEPQGAGLSV